LSKGAGTLKDAVFPVAVSLVVVVRIIVEVLVNMAGGSVIIIVVVVSGTIGTIAVWGLDLILLRLASPASVIWVGVGVGVGVGVDDDACRFCWGSFSSVARSNTVYSFHAKADSGAEAAWLLLLVVLVLVMVARRLLLLLLLSLLVLLPCL